MAMEYVLFNVDRKEYARLKEMESDIIKEAKCERNTFWREKLKSLDMGFCYNPDSRCIGFFLAGKGKKIPYHDSKVNIDEKEILAYNLRNSLASRLLLMRKKQNWIC